MAGEDSPAIFHAVFSITAASFFRRCRAIGLASLLLSPAWCWAIDEATEDSLTTSFASVVDQTMTFTGREFASLFTARWAELNGVAKNDTVIVRERPAGSRGSMITVEYRYRQLYAGFFSPNRAKLKEAATAAADMAVRAVTESDIAQLLFKDPDLASDEF